MLPDERHVFVGRIRPVNYQIAGNGKLVTHLPAG
jgi:hypothetical protein